MYYEIIKWCDVTRLTKKRGKSHKKQLKMVEILKLQSKVVHKNKVTFGSNCWKLFLAFEKGIVIALSQFFVKVYIKNIFYEKFHTEEIQ